MVLLLSAYVCSTSPTYCRAKTTSSSSRRSLASCEAEDFEDDLADVGRNADLYLLYLYVVNQERSSYRFLVDPPVRKAAQHHMGGDGGPHSTLLRFRLLIKFNGLFYNFRSLSLD